ncbi:MAG: aminotransferase class IV, partial [Planctomycetaceae bacterium]|nr:aminotransferase class IV [Planctomycetaceae bacterium]
TGQHLMRAAGQQLNASIFDPRVKSRSRIHLYRADRLVRQIEPQASALLFDETGFGSETIIGNFYLVKDNMIISPRPEHVLGGISQQMVVRLAKQLGLRYEEADISANAILAADEALTSSTGYCLMPVTRFEESLISSGVPGPVFTRLLSAWSEAVGVDIVTQALQVGEARRKALSS